jgi:hypothetical protein
LISGLVAVGAAGADVGGAALGVWQATASDANAVPVTMRTSPRRVSAMSAKYNDEP